MLAQDKAEGKLASKTNDATGSPSRQVALNTNRYHQRHRRPV